MLFNNSNNNVIMFKRLRDVVFFTIKASLYSHSDDVPFNLLQLCELLKSSVECPDLLEKLACAQASVSQKLTGMHQFTIA